MASRSLRGKKKISDHANKTEFWYSGTLPYDHLVITTTFLCPERIESPVISLVLQPR